MQQPMIGRVLNILVMLPIYMLVLLIAKRPGRVYWGLLVLILLHAFQLVLLTIFSGSVVAVDMLLNLFTSEPDEAGELLSNILLSSIADRRYSLCSDTGQSTTLVAHTYGQDSLRYPPARLTDLYRS